MRVLLDECVPRRLGRDLSDHNVRTVVEAGWGGTVNGALLGRAADAFDVFLTVDSNLDHQQNISPLRLPVIVIYSVRNEIEALRPHMADVRKLLSQALENRIYRIGNKDE